MAKIKQYAEICKVVDNDDGTVTVEGIASDGTVDLAGEIITPEAMKAALPGFMSLGTGALREMHQPIAAGVVFKADVNEAGETLITARVVDPVAVLKVKEGVYKGFSIGGNSTERVGKSITGLKLTEISLVDAPCNPNAVIQVWKADFDQEENMSKEQVLKALADLVNKGEINADDITAVSKSLTADASTKPEGDEAPDVSLKKADVPELVTPSADPVLVVLPVTISKGMYSVSGFSDLLTNLSWLASDAQWEAEYEGDNSPVPAQLKQWLADGVAIFQAMAVEESAELLGKLAKYAPAPDIAKALPGTIVADAEKAVVATVDNSGIQKALDAISKLTNDFAVISKAHDALNDKHSALIQKFNALPAVPKAVLAVTKDADTGAAESEPKPIHKSDGSIDDVATQIKKLHSQGGQPI